MNFFKKISQEYHQSVKQSGSRSGPTFCRAWSGTKLFAKVISRRQVATSGNLETLCSLFPHTTIFYRKRVYSKGSKFFPFSVDPFQKEDKTILTELSPLKVCPFPLIKISHSKKHSWNIHVTQDPMKALFRRFDCSDTHLKVKELLTRHLFQQTST